MPRLSPPSLPLLHLPGRIFLAVWLLWVGGLLVAPRLLAPRVAPLIAASPLLHCQPAGLESLPSTPKGAAGGPRAAAAGALRTALAWLLWPVAALFVSATVTGACVAVPAWPFAAVAAAQCCCRCPRPS